MAGKLSSLWIINVISFFLFTLLSVTGLINWLLLPRGYGSGAGFLVSLRHSLVTVHEWTALLFMIVIGIHIWLHWAYLKKNLDWYRESKQLILSLHKQLSLASQTIDLLRTHSKSSPQRHHLWVWKLRNEITKGLKKKQQ